MWKKSCHWVRGVGSESTRSMLFGPQQKVGLFSSGISWKASSRMYVYLRLFSYFSNKFASLSKPESRQEVAGALKVLLVPKPSISSLTRRPGRATLTTQSSTMMRLVMETHLVAMSQEHPQSMKSLLVLTGPKLLYLVALVVHKPQNSSQK